MKRKIITIDEALCNGCGECIPECPEGALRIIDGKARLVSDLFCDGLGACLGHCPQGAITVEERAAEKYDERRVMENIVLGGENVIRAHLQHLKDHRQDAFLREALAYLDEKAISVPPGFTGDTCETKPGDSPCPGSMARVFRTSPDADDADREETLPPSRLGHWPVQLNLVPPGAPFLEGADLLVAADCVPVAYAGFHEDLLRGRVVVCGCPKFDDNRLYLERLTGYFQQHDIKSVTTARMEVPCCRGIVTLVEEALKASGKDIPFQEVVIGIRGEKK